MRRMPSTNHLEREDEDTSRLLDVIAILYQDQIN